MSYSKSLKCLMSKLRKFLPGTGGGVQKPRLPIIRNLSKFLIILNLYDEVGYTFFL